MKVKELIDELKFYNPNANVLFYKNDSPGGYLSVMTYDYDDFFPKVDENNEIIVDENGYSEPMQYTPKNTPYATIVFQKDNDHKEIVAKYKVS